MLSRIAETNNKIKVTELFKVRNQIQEHFLCQRKVAGSSDQRQACIFEAGAQFCDLCKTTDVHNLRCKYCSKIQCRNCLFNVKLANDLKVYTERIAKMYEVTIKKHAK